MSTLTALSFGTELSIMNKPADLKQMPPVLSRQVPLLGALPAFRLHLSACVLLSLFSFLLPCRKDTSSSFPHSSSLSPCLSLNFAGKGVMTFDHRPTTLLGSDCVICHGLVSHCSGIMGGRQAPQSGLRLSRESADLEGFSDVANDPGSTPSSISFRGQLCALPACDSSTPPRVLLVTLISLLGDLKPGLKMPLRILNCLIPYSLV